MTYVYSEELFEMRILYLYDFGCYDRLVINIYEGKTWNPGHIEICSLGKTWNPGHIETCSLYQNILKK
jgi:hypothetical protein